MHIVQQNRRIASIPTLYSCLYAWIEPPRPLPRADAATSSGRQG